MVRAGRPKFAHIIQGKSIVKILRTYLYGTLLIIGSVFLKIITTVLYIIASDNRNKNDARYRTIISISSHEILCFTVTVESAVIRGAGIKHHASR